MVPFHRNICVSASEPDTTDSVALSITSRETNAPVAPSARTMPAVISWFISTVMVPSPLSNAPSPSGTPTMRHGVVPSGLTPATSPAERTEVKRTFGCEATRYGVWPVVYRLESVNFSTSTFVSVSVPPFAVVTVQAPGPLRATVAAERATLKTTVSLPAPPSTVSPSGVAVKLSSAAVPVALSAVNTASVLRAVRFSIRRSPEAGVSAVL